MELETNWMPSTFLLLRVAAVDKRARIIVLTLDVGCIYTFTRVLQGRQRCILEIILRPKTSLARWTAITDFTHTGTSLNGSFFRVNPELTCA